MAKKDITIDDKALNAMLERAVKNEPKLAGEALMDCILDLSAESAKMAPIESGDLRSNCTGKIESEVIFANQQAVGGTVPDKNIIGGSVGYSLPYARRQHEDLALRHDRTDGYRIMTGKNAGKTVSLIAGGEAKFLEKPFLERKDRYIKRFGKALEDSFK